MKLKKFKEKNRKRTGIIVFTITCILLVSGVILYRTFAIFEVRTNQNVIKGTVQDPGNLYFAFYQMNEESREYEIQKEMPKKESEYVLDEEQSYCGVNGGHDSNIKVSLTEDYRVIVSGMTTSRTKCNLYFVKGKFIQGKGIPIVEDGDGLYEVSHEDYTGEENGWKNTELRFAGKDPKNYVWFNDELWRMIGLVNVKTSEGNIEQRLKIRKNEPIGRYSWDYEESINSGKNNWENSSLQKLLNQFYYNEENADYITCSQMNSSNNGVCDIHNTFSINFSETGIKLNSRNKIEKVTWNLGGPGAGEYYQKNGIVKYWYSNERGELTLSENSSTWSGFIGLVYPSDYAYATNGGDLGREKCFETSLYYWSNAENTLGI